MASFSGSSRNNFPFRKRPRRMRVKKYNIDFDSNTSSIDMAGRIDEGQQGADKTASMSRHSSFCSFPHHTINPRREDEEKIRGTEISSGISTTIAEGNNENREVSSAHYIDKKKQPASFVGRNEAQKDYGGEESENDDDVGEIRMKPIKSGSFVFPAEDMLSDSGSGSGSGGSSSSSNGGGGGKSDINNDSNNEHQIKETTMQFMANRAMLSLTLFGKATEKKEEEEDDYLMSKSPSSSSTLFSIHVEEEEIEQEEVVVAAANVLAKFPSDDSAKQHEESSNYKHRYLHSSSFTSTSPISQLHNSDSKLVDGVGGCSSVEDSIIDQGEALNNLTRKNDGLRIELVDTKFELGNSQNKTKETRQEIAEITMAQENTIKNLENEREKLKRELENRQHDNFNDQYQYRHKNDDLFKTKDDCECRIIERNNKNSNVNDYDVDLPSTTLTESSHSEAKEDEKEKERIIVARKLVFAAILQRKVNRSVDREQRFRIWEEHGIYIPDYKLSSASSNSESVSITALPIMNETSIYNKNARPSWWKRLGNKFHRRAMKATPKDQLSLKEEENYIDLEIRNECESTDEPIKFCVSSVKKRENKDEEDNEKKKTSQIPASFLIKKENILSVKLKLVDNKKYPVNVKNEFNGQPDICESIALGAAAEATKIKCRSMPMSEEYFDKLSEPKKEKKLADLAAQAASMALAVKESSCYLKTAEDYDNLYKKPRQQNEEPKLMVELKPVGEKRSSFMHRELQEQSEGNAVEDLEEDVEGSISAHSGYVSITVQSSLDKDQFGCTKRVWYRVILCFVIMLILVAIAIIVYYLAFADTREEIDIILPVVTKTPSYQSIRDPSLFPSFSPKMVPTTISPPIQSQIPSFRRPARAPLTQPETPPIITSQPIFQTVAPTPPGTIDLSTYRVTTNPTASSDVAPSQAPQLKPSTLKNLLFSRWPSLKESIAIPNSSQGKAFRWLTNSTLNLNTYSELQLIQRFTMATFYYSTNGEYWYNNDGWLSKENECLWYQTKGFRKHCNASGSLVNLELDGNGLSGSLPSELALLSSSLVRLELATGTRVNGSNEAFIRGNLPSEFGLLTTLEYMNLSSQQMIGTIPSAICELSLLTVLDLERNKFEGSVMTNIGQLQQLHNLYLGFNLLSSSIPSEFGRLQFLVNLDLYGNQLSSTIPSELGKLSYLQTISLGYNRLTGSIPSSLGNLSNLQGTVDLSVNLLTGTIPSELGQLTMILTVLNLSSNQLYGPIPTQLGRFTSLGNLQLQKNSLSGAVPSSFSGLLQLQNLQLEYNDLTGDVPSSVCDALVTDKIDNKTAPTHFVTDCFTKIDCKCCQYCCEEEIGCECQFNNNEELDR